MTTESPSQAPRVWGWYVAYAVAMALLYALCLAGGIALVILKPQLDSEEIPPELMGLMFAAISAPLFLLYAAAPFLPRTPWVWVYHLVLICIGLSSTCCLPACIPLMIYWLKPETKLWFGRSVPTVSVAGPPR